MRHYTAIVHEDDGSAIGLSFPDLPGCHAAADSWDGIAGAVADALDLWFEDQPQPQPRSLDDLRRDPEVARDLAQGAMLMAFPYIAPDGAPVRANISIERGLLRAIDETAASRKMTRSAFLAALARREITGV